MLQKMKETLKKCDLFATSQFLRYKQEGEYATISGAVCSLIVITIFCILFLNVGIRTANKDIINWSSEVTNTVTPTQSLVKISPQNKFMFSLGFKNINYNSLPYRLFDFSLTSLRIQENYVGFQDIELEPCTQQHFSIDQDIQKEFLNMGLSQRLCPAIGSEFALEGKYTSSNYKYAFLQIGQCSNNTKNSSKPCANASEINQSGINYFLELNFVNPAIDPGSNQYISYYNEDQNQAFFSRQLAFQGNINFQEYTIETDESLLPYTSIKIQKGLILSENTKSFTKLVENDNYLTINFQKSSRSVTYKRAFNKFDQFFAYVGGLIGTILGMMMFMNKFSEMSFEINIGKRLFEVDGRKKFDKSFNVFYYFQYVFYSFVSLFGCTKSWTTMRTFDQIHEEVTQQLDIRLLLERIIFLERTVQYMLTKEQVDCLHLQKKFTIAEIKRKRFRYELPQRLRIASKENGESEKGEDNQESGEPKESGENIQNQDAKPDNSLNKSQSSQKIQIDSVDLSEVYFTAQQNEKDGQSEERARNRKRNLVILDLMNSIDQTKTNSLKDSKLDQRIYQNMSPSALKILKDKNLKKPQIPSLKEQISINGAKDFFEQGEYTQVKVQKMEKINQNFYFIQ